jgi:predicted nuclease of predicted toxin-antitoxin system
MRFLVDAQLPPALVDGFKSKGRQAEHVFEQLGADRPDAFIAQTSIATAAVVVTKDNDFLQLQENGRPQIIWVRIGNTANQRLLERFESEWARVFGALSRGEDVVELH